MALARNALPPAFAPLADLDPRRVMALRRLPPELANRAAPSPEQILGSLRLHPRTQNCLVRYSAGAAPTSGPWTVGRLLSIPGFGLRALVDVADAVRDARTARDERTKHLEDELAPLLTARPHLVPQVSTPLLEKAIEEIGPHMPCSEEEILSLLVQAGLSRGGLTLGDLERAARFIDRPLPFAVLRRDDLVLAVPAALLAPAKRIHAVAARSAVLWTIVSLDLVGARASTQDLDLVRAVVSARPGFEWLDRRRGWFWFRAETLTPGFGKGLPKLAQDIEKLLFVSPSLPWGDLASALYRRRPPDLHPPVNVLRGFCGRFPAFVVEGDDLRLARAPKPELVLTERERRMVDFFRARGPKVEGPKSRELAAAVGLGVDALLRTLRTSLIVFERPSGVFQLVGT